MTNEAVNASDFLSTSPTRILPWALFFARADRKAHADGDSFANEVEDWSLRADHVAETGFFLD